MGYTARIKWMDEMIDVQGGDDLRQKEECLQRR